MRGIDYKTQGFYKGKREAERQSVNSKDIAWTFVGYRLDEIEVHATIKSQEQLDDFIKFLHNSRPCFG